MTAYRCHGCDATFDADGDASPRCPTCLKRTTVKPVLVARPTRRKPRIYRIWGAVSALILIVGMIFAVTRTQTKEQAEAVGVLCGSAIGLALLVAVAIDLAWRLRNRKGKSPGADAS